MLNISFNAEELREVIREEVKAAINESRQQMKELPPFLTRSELKQLFHIGETKVSELLSRSDFPVFREAGVLIPTHLLMQWVEANMDWVRNNANYLKSIS